MAKRIKVGEPVNAAEAWAFKFLEANLPTEYLLPIFLDFETNKSGQFFL